MWRGRGSSPWTRDDWEGFYSPGEGPQGRFSRAEPSPSLPRPVGDPHVPRWARGTRQPPLPHSSFRDDETSQLLLNSPQTSYFDEVPNFADFSGAREERTEGEGRRSEGWGGEGPTRAAQSLQASPSSEEEDFNEFCQRIAARMGASSVSNLIGSTSPTSRGGSLTAAHDAYAGGISSWQREPEKDESLHKVSQQSVEVRVMLTGAETASSPGLERTGAAPSGGVRTPTSPWDYSSILTRSREERGSEAATEPDRDDQSTSSDPADRKAQRSHSVSGPLQDKVPELASTPRGAGMGPSAGPTSLPSSHEGWQSNHLYDGDISFEEADMPSMVDEAQFSAQESGIAPGEGRARRSSLPPSMSPEAPNSPALSPRSGSNGARPPGGPDLAEFVHNSPLRAQRRTIDALDNPQNTGKAPLLPTWQEASEGSVYDQTTARNLAAARGLGSDMEGVKVGGAPVSHGLGFDRQGAGRGTSPISHGPDLERARGTLLASYDLGTDVEGIQGTPPASYGYGSDWEGVRSNLPGSHGLKSDLQGSRSTPRVSYSRGSDVEGSRNPLDSYGVSMDQDGSLGPEVWSHPEGPKLFSDYRTGGGGQGTRPGWGRQDAASSFRGHGSSSDGQEGLDSDEPSSNSGSAWLQPFPEGSTLRRGEGPVARGAAALSPGSSAGTRWMSAEEFLSANDAAPSDRERSLPPPKAPSLPSPSLTAFEASGFPSVAGGELQELSEEERALESELSSIDQALRQRLSVPAAGSLSSAASLLLHQGDERQNRPSSNCSSGPTELLPGQARNNDMYVPSGGSGRWGGAGGGSLPDGPFPVSSDLWASRRSSSPAPEGGDAAPSQPAAGPYEWQGGRPRPATKGREDLDVRVAERMYAPAVEARQRLRSQREVIKREREEAAMSGCTFRPAICPRSAGIAGRAKGRGQGVWDVAPKEQRGRASSAPKERGPSPARWRRPGPGAVRSADPNWWRDFEHGLEAPAVRGFDLVQRGSDDYEAQLAASIARVGAQPPANLEVLSAVNNHVRAGQMSDPEDEDPGPQLRTCKPDEVVVTTACHRLYNQGLEHMEKMAEKRRRAREQEIKMSRTAIESIKTRPRSRTPSPAPRVPVPPTPHAAPPSARGTQRPSSVSPARRPGIPVSAPQSRPRKNSPNEADPVFKKHNEEDFEEFLRRQSKFLNKREAKINAAIEAQLQREPSALSEGSRRILRQKEDMAKLIEDELVALGYLQVGEYCALKAPMRGKKEDYMADTLASASKYSSPPLTTSTASFMQRLEIAVSGGSGGLASNGGKGSGGPQSPDPGSWERRVADPECTFKPKITKKGTSQKPRSFEDMSEGDRLKKEAWRTRKQREKEAREMEGVTFSPRLNNSRNSTSKLCLEDTAVYMEFVDQRNRAREAKVQQQKVRNAEEEVAGCTFAPQVSPRPPRYIERIARSHSARVAAGLVYDEGAAVTSRWK